MDYMETGRMDTDSVHDGSRYYDFVTLEKFVLCDTFAEMEAPLEDWFLMIKVVFLIFV